MEILGLILFLVGLDRVMASGRVRALAQLRPRWSRARAIVLHYMRTAPATYAYAFVLLITSWVLQTSSTKIADRLLLERSTNLDHLGRDPVRVLFASAFWLENGTQFFAWLVLLTLVMAPFERRVGSALTIGVFTIGHVFATLLTAAGLWAALQIDAVEHSVANARDVGASYGFLAVAACFGYLVDRRLRPLYLSGLIVVVALLAAIWTDFTSFGHLLSVALGLACYPLVRRHAVRLAPAGRQLADLVEVLRLKARRRSEVTATPRG